MSPEEASSVSTLGPSTELTPASGSLPAASPNSLAVTSAGTTREASVAAAEPARKPDVIYVPTPQPVVDRMLQMAQVKKDDVVYDLGCGDGRIVVTAAKRYGTRAFGFDIDPQRVAEAKANVKAAKVEHLVTIEQRDIFTLDLSPASVVTLYLLPELNVRLIPQLEKLKPGSRIVSHDFPMEGVKPLQHVTLKPSGESDHAIYLWKTPLAVEQRKEP
jgi:SAM-dependent methyltransferase